MEGTKQHLSLFLEQTRSTRAGGLRRRDSSLQMPPEDPSATKPERARKESAEEKGSGGELAQFRR